MRTFLNVRRVVYDGMTGVGPTDAKGRPEAWNCTTCSNCTERCPKGVKPMELIIGLRSAAIEKGRIEPTIRDALESTFKHGNPWGRIRDKRTEWAEELSVPVAAEGEAVPFLFYVGCTPAYDPRAQSIAKALVTIFAAAGVDALIRKMQETFRLTSIVVTHEMESVKLIADTVCMLESGQVVAIGSLEELERSGHPYVHQFLARQPDTEEGGDSSYARSLTGID